MATPNWLNGPGQIERVVGEGHPLYENTKDRCGQTIQAMIEEEHSEDGVHDARNTGLSMEIDTFSGNGAARTISLSNAGLTPKKIFVWEMTPGTDFCTNGEFSSDTTGWTAVNCTLASVAGGQSGNCLQITQTGGVNQTAYQSVTTLVTGRTYRLSGYVKSGTSGNEAFIIQVTGAGLTLQLTGTSSGSWVQYSGTAIATGSTTEIDLIKNTATAGTMLFDTIVLEEVGGSDITRIDEMTSDKAQSYRYQSAAWEIDLIDNEQAGSFDVGDTYINTNGETNYYCVLGIDTDTVPVGDTGAGSDPDWITSSVLNRIIADNSAVVSVDNIANNVESQIWTQFVEEHTVDGAHSVTLQHVRIETIDWAGNDADDRTISCSIDDLDIMLIEIYEDGSPVAFKSSDMAGDTAKRENIAAFAANYIQDITTTNGEFEVGTGLNASGNTYVAYIIGV
jgi:hypothetical protein